MTVEDLIVYGKKYLHTMDVKLLLSFVLGYDNLELLNHLNDFVSDDIVFKYKDIIKRLLDGEAIQYIIGNVNFYGNEFKINKNVLIPRFETEELVEKTLNILNEKFSDYDSVKILDVGCGSGVIGITLDKLYKKSIVTCSDISQYALDTTALNAKLLESDINVIKSDMLKNINGKYDVIISNPPYIMEEEQIELKVKNNEPHIALYGGKDGLKYYREILSTAKKNLNDKYLIAFEIGWQQKDAIISIAKEFFDNSTIECFQDMSQKDRIILIYNV